MTDPEQETGPPDHAPKMPPGWVDAGDGLARPDPSNPETYPPEFVRQEHRDFAALDSDPDIQEVANRLRVALQVDLDRMRAAHALPREALSPEEGTRLQNLSEAFLNHQLLPRVLDALDDLPSQGIPQGTRRHYIIRLLMIDAGYAIEEIDTLAREIVGSRSAPRLLANFTTEAVQVVVTLPPGGFVMEFSHATQTDRHRFDKLIEDTQAALGYDVHPDRGGPTADDTVAREVARLKVLYPKMTNREIATHIGRPGLTSQRVGQLNRQGRRLFLQLYGPQWIDRVKAESKKTNIKGES